VETGDLLLPKRLKHSAMLGGSWPCFGRTSAKRCLRPDFCQMPVLHSISARAGWRYTILPGLSFVTLHGVSPYPCRDHGPVSLVKSFLSTNHQGDARFSSKSRGAGQYGGLKSRPKCVYGLAIEPIATFKTGPALMSSLFPAVHHHPRVPAVCS
jgi:hypothetical protein